MILAEPPPSQGDLHFSLLGFPVRIHPFFWLMTLLLGPFGGKPIYALMWVVAVLICILLHELGHAVVMKFYGYYPSIVLYSFGGLTIPQRGPYSVRRPGPWGDMLIAFAGPASGFILAALLVLGFHNLGGCPFTVFQPSWHDVVPTIDIGNFNLFLFVHFILYICVWWGLVNLLPIYPLDGGLIAQQAFFLKNPQNAMRQSLVLSVAVGGIVTAVTLIQALNQARQVLDQPHGVDVFALLTCFFLPLFFGYLTFTNYETLQSYRIRGGW